MRRADGIVYVNLSCINPINSGRNIPVVFTQQSSLNLIDDISRYNMGVVRFSVPTGLIPANVIEEEIVKSTGTTGYIVSMEIDANVVRADVPFSSDVITSDNNVNYYSYYSKYELLRQVNIALDTAYTAMRGIDGSLPSDPPVIIYNVATKLYELWTPQEAIKRPNPISIYLNSSLNALFDFPYITNTFSDVLNSKIIIQDGVWNIRYMNSDIITQTIPYYVSFTERETAYAPSFQKLILVSNNGLNTASEYIQSPQSAINSNNPTTTSANILTDFEVDFTSNNSGFLQFQSSGVGNVRLIEFLGTGHIQSFSINMYYQLFNNNVFPLSIRPGETASLKIAFIPKSYFLQSLSWN
jgi:hypothetical protein